MAGLAGRVAPERDVLRGGALRVTAAVRGVACGGCCAYDDRPAGTVEQGLALATALERAGVPSFAVRGAEQQLRHLGRKRANQLYNWLLEVDFGMKGGSPLPPRILLERLIVRLGHKAAG